MNTALVTACDIVSWIDHAAADRLQIRRCLGTTPRIPTSTTASPPSRHAGGRWRCPAPPPADGLHQAARIFPRKLSTSERSFSACWESSVDAESTWLEAAPVSLAA